MCGNGYSVKTTPGLHGQGWALGEAMDYLHLGSLSSSIFGWIQPCCAVQASLQFSKWTEQTNRTKILFFPQQRFSSPRFQMLSVISRSQVCSAKQADEYGISVNMSVSTPCCIVAVSDMHFCHRRSYRQSCWQDNTSILWKKLTMLKKMVLLCFQM